MKIYLKQATPFSASSVIEVDKYLETPSGYHVTWTGKYLFVPFQNIICVEFPTPLETEKKKVGRPTKSADINQ